MYGNIFSHFCLTFFLLLAHLCVLFGAAHQNRSIVAPVATAMLGRFGVSRGLRNPARGIRPAGFSFRGGHFYRQGQHYQALRRAKREQKVLQNGDVHVCEPPARDLCLLFVSFSPPPFPLPSPPKPITCRASELSTINVVVRALWCCRHVIFDCFGTIPCAAGRAVALNGVYSFSTYLYKPLLA